LLVLGAGNPRSLEIADERDLVELRTHEPSDLLPHLELLGRHHEPFAPEQLPGDEDRHKRLA
jgi:hypothetical protein